jgi:hypothetical protein
MKTLLIILNILLLSIILPFEISKGSRKRTNKKIKKLITTVKLF